MSIFEILVAKYNCIKLCVSGI